MIVDFHTHIDRIPALGWDMGPDTIIGAMDAHGVELSVVTSMMDAPILAERGLDDLARVVAESDGRLVALARLHPWSPNAVALLRRAVGNLGFVGLKLHPVSTIAAPDGEPTLRLLREAARLGVPTMFHCGDDPFTTPWEIARAAAAVPDGVIVLAHSGGYAHTLDAIEVARRQPNIVLETAANPYPDLLRSAIAAIGPERVVFGSDGPGTSLAVELRKIDLLELDDESRHLVLSANALHMIGARS